MRRWQRSPTTSSSGPAETGRPLAIIVGRHDHPLRANRILSGWSSNGIPREGRGEHQEAWHRLQRSGERPRGSPLDNIPRRVPRRGGRQRFLTIGASVHEDASSWWPTQTGMIGSASSAPGVQRGANENSMSKALVELTLTIWRPEYDFAAYEGRRSRKVCRPASQGKQPSPPRSRGRGRLPVGRGGQRGAPRSPQHHASGARQRGPAEQGAPADEPRYTAREEGRPSRRGSRLTASVRRTGERSRKSRPRHRCRCKRETDSVIDRRAFIGSLALGTLAMPHVARA